MLRITLKRKINPMTGKLACVHNKTCITREKRVYEARTNTIYVTC